MTHPLDLTVEEVKRIHEGGLLLPTSVYWETMTARLNAAYESKRLAERGNSPGIGGIPNNHSNYDRDSKVGD